MSKFKTDVVFFFDKERYNAEIRRYGKAINVSNEIISVIQDAGFVPTLGLVTGLMQVHEERKEAQTHYEIVGDASTPAMQELYLATTPEADKALQDIVTDMCNAYPPALRKKYESEIQASITTMLCKCMQIRDKWQRGTGNVLQDIDYNAFGFNGSLYIKKEHLEAIKEACYVKPMNADKEKMYKALCHICEELNEIVPTATNPNMLLQVLEYSEYREHPYTLTQNFNFNYL